MIETRSHQILTETGLIRVLRLVTDGERCVMLAYEEIGGPGMCRECGCTDRYGCPEGCSWVDLAHTVCSRCFKKWMLPNADRPD